MRPRDFKRITLRTHVIINTMMRFDGHLSNGYGYPDTCNSGLIEYVGFLIYIHVVFPYVACT